MNLAALELALEGLPGSSALISAAFWARLIVERKTTRAIVFDQEGLRSLICANSLKKGG